MIPLHEARQFVLSRCARNLPVRLSLDQALGCVLAETIRSNEDIPPFANSAMDGYAVHAADTVAAPVRLDVIDRLMAGDPGKIVVEPGQAARIMTGAPIPGGVDAVCMIEQTEDGADGSSVVVGVAVAAGENVRPAGGDIAAGAEVFGPGTALTPAHIGVLASLGITSAEVYPQPRVGVLSTGDELVDVGSALQPGKIRDSNRPALLSQVRRDGFIPVDLGRAGDDETVLTRILEEGASRCDAIVTSGGVSVGDVDLVKVVLEKLSAGAMRWMQIAIKPAKPFAFGTLAPDGTPLFGLPGNPVSALVSYELLVRPALRQMAGLAPLDRPRLRAVADKDFPRQPDGKQHFQRAQVAVGDDGTLLARPSGGQQSHMLRAMADANALAVLADGEGAHAGDRLEILALDPDRFGTAAKPSRESWTDR